MRVNSFQPINNRRAFLSFNLTNIILHGWKRKVDLGIVFFVLFLDYYAFLSSSFPRSHATWYRSNGRGGERKKKSMLNMDRTFRFRAYSWSQWQLYPSSLFIQLKHTSACFPARSVARYTTGLKWPQRRDSNKPERLRPLEILIEG